MAFFLRLLGREVLVPAGSLRNQKSWRDPVCYLQRDDIQLGEELARGGFGKVSSARLQTRCGWVEVVVKEPLESNTQSALELRNEAWMTRLSWCEWVPEVFGLVLTPSFSGLVMAHGGNSLEDLDSMPHDELLIAFRMVTSALNFLHVERCVVHLDLKPSNVLKLANKYMLADFDAAACIEVPEQPLERQPGNLYFAPPSVWQGGGHLATLTDAYMTAACFKEVASAKSQIDVGDLFAPLLEPQESRRQSLQSFSRARLERLDACPNSPG